MNGPRIVITQLTSPRQIKQWHEHCLPALGEDAATSKNEQPPKRVVWQLSSANHRALARSVRVHASFEDALADVVETRENFAQAKPRALKISARSEYVWVASLGAQRRLVSARTYSTVRDTRDAIIVTTHALTAASITRRTRTMAAAS